MMKRLLATARHEAAHGVLAEVFGMRVKLLELNPREDILGLCHYDGRCRLGPLRMGIVLAAGTVIDAHYGRIKSEDWSSGDLDLLIEQGFRNSDLAQLRELTRIYVGRYRKPIEKVAKVLVKHDLTGRQFRTILRSCG